MRRALTATAVAGGLALATAGAWAYQYRAQQAEIAAAVDETLADLASRYTAIADAVGEGAEVAATLRTTLEDHVTVVERSDEDIIESRRRYSAALAEAGQRIVAVTDRPEPAVRPPARPEDVRAEMRAFRDVRGEARALGERLVGLAQAGERWGAAVFAVHAAGHRYAAVDRDQPQTHDPRRLAGLWEEAGKALAEYRAAADALRDVPGLAPLAEAHLNLIGDHAGFIDKAVPLLRRDRVDEYNRLLDETFRPGQEEQFQESIAAAIRTTLETGVLADLDAAEAEAGELARLADARGRRLAPHASPS